MDDGGENISWVDNLFQKLEDFYSEVDVAVREEIRNVENHWQTIGVNFVNFYRDMVPDEPPQSSEDVVVEEAADDSIDILTSDASKLRIDGVHHKEETKKELALDIGYLVSYPSEMDNGKDHYEKHTEEEDDASGTDTEEDYSEEEADDASEIITDEDYSEEDTDEEADNGSEIDTDEDDSEEDTEEEKYDASDIETYKYNSEEDTEEEALSDNDVLVSGASKTLFNEGRRKRKVDREVYEKIKMIAEKNLAKKNEESIPKKKDVVTNTNEFDSCESKGLDVELTHGNASTVSPVAEESIAEAISDDDDTEVDKEIIDSFESIKIDEHRDMTDRTEFEITGKNEEEGMLGLRKQKTIKLFGVRVEIPEDELCDSEWVIV